ncbi:TPA: hypothetical protein N0H38_004431 [Pseudomonas aeruginosa]|nr:hypothetical protein [Pseudomonas aeruginosa]HCK4574130.1 hypothetical protein [Pseudomonas aeruginosa]HCK4790573.1 hypothetical protein [Pseudomonas aeruginosa]HCK4799615.1 hypothetical protein [Pseudomonas aeruginosa]HCK5645989.1 hypothetical protein [Pseudomonas aeruginosa]
MRNPLAHYRAVQTEADSLLARQVITPGEYHDLSDIAEAAYMHTLEEKAGELFEQAAAYDVHDLQTGERTGVITRGTYLLCDPAARRKLSPIDGLVRYDKKGQLSMVEMNGDNLGAIRGLTWVDRSGAAFSLLKVKSYCDGQSVPHLGDVEACRMALNRLELAREENDAPTVQRLQQALAAAPFGLCPDCRDRFDLVDDCVVCQGLGIVGRHWSPSQ